MVNSSSSSSSSSSSECEDTAAEAAVSSLQGCDGLPRKRSRSAGECHRKTLHHDIITNTTNSTTTNCTASSTSTGGGGACSSDERKGGSCLSPLSHDTSAVIRVAVVACERMGETPATDSSSSTRHHKVNSSSSTRHHKVNSSSSSHGAYCLAGDDDEVGEQEQGQEQDEEQEQEREEQEEQERNGCMTSETRRAFFKTFRAVLDGSR